MNVFVVEDSLVVRERLVAMLGEIAGVRITGEADNPADAISDILFLRPNVVVLDIKLKGGSGIEVMRGIRNQAPGIMIIVLSNYDTPEHRQQYLAAGANHFFDKTRDFEKVSDLLDGLAAAETRH